MRYLYGDSSESDLDINYLAFLRDAIDLCVELMLCDTALEKGREQRAARERATADAIRAVEALGREVTAMVEPVQGRGGDTPVVRLAAAIARGTADAVGSETARARSALAGDVAAVTAEAGRLGERAVAALGRLLMQHDLPGAEQRTLVRWNGGGYIARLAQRSPFGLEVAMELEVPASSIFAHDLRVDRVVEGGVDAHAPEPSGWLKKEIKMVPHKLGRHHVTEVIAGAVARTVKLRATAEANAPGFDIIVDDAGRLRLERAGQGAEGAPPFDTDPRDEGPLGHLVERLAAAADALGEHRRALAAATLSGRALSEHPHPRALVEQLVAQMAPVVQKIAAHSLTPTELVIKRLLAGDRREEIFVPKSELVQKLGPLPAPLRMVFEPLGLVDEETVTAVGKDPLAASAAQRKGNGMAPLPSVSEVADVDSALRRLESEVEAEAAVEEEDVRPVDAEDVEVEPEDASIVSGVVDSGSGGKLR